MTPATRPTWPGGWWGMAVWWRLRAVWRGWVASWRTPTTTPPELTIPPCWRPLDYCTTPLKTHPGATYIEPLDFCQRPRISTPPPPVKTHARRWLFPRSIHTWVVFISVNRSETFCHVKRFAMKTSFLLEFRKPLLVSGLFSSVWFLVNTPLKVEVAHEMQYFLKCRKINGPVGILQMYPSLLPFLK